MNNNANDWPEDFPPVTSLAPYAALRYNPDPEMQALYDRAKNHEDREAAAELIDRMVSDEGVENIKMFAARHPGAVLVSVHAIEGHGRNAIPHTLAHFIAEQTGLEVDDNIVQNSIVSKTGRTSSWYRMAHRTQFEGNVQSGKDYIMVDDAFSAGGTFNDLRQFIEQNGGKVVDSITMANGAKNRIADIAITKQHILELERKYGVESLQQFLKEESLYGGNHRALTDAEARTFLGAASLDEARDQLAAARQKGNRRVRPEMVQGTSPNNEEVINTPQTDFFTGTTEHPSQTPAPSGADIIVIRNKEAKMDADEITVENYREYIKGTIDRQLDDFPIPLTPEQAFNLMQSNIMARDHIPRTQNKQLLRDIKRDLGFQTEPEWWNFKQDSEWNINAYLSEKIGIAFPREAENISKEARMANEDKGELKQDAPEESEAVERKPEQAAQAAAVDNLANFAGGFAMAAGAHLPHGGLAPQNQRQAQRDISHNTPAPRQAEKTKNKEAGMANEEARGNTPEERAFWAAVHQRKVVADALKAGTLSCLPGKDGVADTEPAVNIANGTRYHGANLLFLKEHQKQNGFPTAEYVTQNAVQESGIPIRAGQHGVDIKISEKNEQSGEWENKTVRLFNVAQSAKPWEMKQWAADKLDAEAREKQEFLKKQFGDNFVPQQKREAQKGADVVCSSTEPEKYLGQYLAAVSMGSKFKATAEQAAEFSKNFEGALFAKNANGHSNPFELSKLCGKANEVCKETVKQIHAREIAPRQQEIAQKRGRGM